MSSSSSTSRVPLAPLDKIERLHEMMLRKKRGYRAQERTVVKEQVAAGKAEDRARTRAADKQIAEICDRMDKKADEERTERDAATRAFDRRRKTSCDHIGNTMRTQAMDFHTWRKDMLARTARLPPLCGEPPPPAKPIRERTLEGIAQLERQTREYMTYIREMEAKFVPEQFAGTGSQNARIVAEKVEAGLRQLAKMYHEYMAQLDEIDSRGDSKLAVARAELSQRMMECQRLRSASFASTANKMLETRLRYVSWRDDMQSRITHRSKSYAGYAPIVKSKRRVAIEEIEDQMGETLCW